MSLERRLKYLAICICASAAAFLAAGCPKSESGAQALDKALSDSGKSKAAVFPLAGVITVDGQPPVLRQPGDRIVVMRSNAAAPESSDKNRNYTVATPKGEFHFGTYSATDGVAPGKYVLTFAMLRKKSGKGHLLGPDGFKNLYNDPEKNAKLPDFVIDHQAPGKSDYAFDLKLAGQEEAQPGPKAIKELH